MVEQPPLVWCETDGSAGMDHTLRTAAELAGWRPVLHRLRALGPQIRSVDEPPAAVVVARPATNPLGFPRSQLAIGRPLLSIVEDAPGQPALAEVWDGPPPSATANTASREETLSTVVLWLKEQRTPGLAPVAVLVQLVEELADALAKIVARLEQEQARAARLEHEVEFLQRLAGLLAHLAREDRPNGQEAVQLARTTRSRLRDLLGGAVAGATLIQGAVSVEQHVRWQHEDEATQASSVVWGTPGVAQLCATTDARCEVLIRFVER